MENIYITTLVNIFISIAKFLTRCADILSIKYKNFSNATYFYFIITEINYHLKCFTCINTFNYLYFILQTSSLIVLTYITNA